MKHANIITISVLALSALCLFSCRKVFDKAKWEPEASFPIAYSELTIQDLMSDTTVFKSDSTGLATVVFKQKLDSLSLNVLDTFSAPPFYRNFKLDSLRLEIAPFIQRFSLGQAAHILMESDNDLDSLLGAEILNLHGRTLSSSFLAAFLPEKLGLPVESIPLNLNQFFQTAVMRSGQLRLTMANEFPMKVSRFDFAIKNASATSNLIEETGIQIDPNSSFSKTYDLAGKTVEGSMIVNIPIFELELDKNVIIDTNDALAISMEFLNLQVSSATAIFPDQDVVTDKQAVALEDMGDLELKEAIIEEGNLVLDVVSTMQDSIFLTYKMPRTTQNGIPLVFEGVVPPAQPGSNTVLRMQVPVKDYTFNLSTAPDYYNRFEYEFRAHVKNTGKQVFLSLADSIVINVYLKQVRPRYVRGYLGSLDTSISSTVYTDLFSDINVQSISPEKVKLNLHVDNGMGVQGKVQLDYLKAFNDKGQSVEATDPQLFGQYFQIAPATNPPFKESASTISSGSASNFPDLVSILPNRFDYSIKAQVGGLPKDTNYFVFNTSRLKPELQIEVPLHLSVQGLLLKDTLPINPSELNLETKGATFKLLAYNGFPFTATVQVTFLTEAGGSIVLNGYGRMEAADIDPSSGKVVAKKFSKIELPVDDAQLHSIARSRQVVIASQFNTPPGEKVKIYSDYSAQLTLAAKVGPKLSR